MFEAFGLGEDELEGIDGLLLFQGQFEGVAFADKPGLGAVDLGIGGAEPEHVACAGAGYFFDGLFFAHRAVDVAWLVLASDVFWESVLVLGDVFIGEGRNCQRETVGRFAKNGFGSGLLDENRRVCPHKFVYTLIFVSIPRDFGLRVLGIKDLMVFVKELAHILRLIDEDIAYAFRGDAFTDAVLDHAGEVGPAVDGFETLEIGVHPPGNGLLSLIGQARVGRQEPHTVQVDLEERSVIV